MAAVLAPEDFIRESVSVVKDHPAVLRAKKLTEYRRRLVNAPWFYEHFDDQADWRAGRDYFKALHELQAEVDPAGAIWREVAPAVMACGLAIPQPRVVSSNLVDHKARRKAVASMQSGFKPPAKVLPPEDDDIGAEAWEEIERQMAKDD